MSPTRFVLSGVAACVFVAVFHEAMGGGLVTRTRLSLDHLRRESLRRTAPAASPRPASRPPAQRAWDLCVHANGTRYHGRQINQKTAASAEACVALCVEDSGCSFVSYEGAPARACHILAALSRAEEVAVDAGAARFHSADCVKQCEADPARAQLVEQPEACTAQRDVWHEGGGPKGGYESQIHGRDEGETAACSAKAPTHEACAAACDRHPRCRFYNWRASDGACHRFALRGQRHDGDDGRGHHTGECAKENDMDTDE